MLRERVEERLHLKVDDLAAVLAVEAVKGFGPQKFRELYESGITPAEVICFAVSPTGEGQPRRSIQARAGSGH